MEILLLQGDAQRRLTVWRANPVTAGRCVAAPYRVAGKSCYCREMRSGALPCGGQLAGAPRLPLKSSPGNIGNLVVDIVIAGR